MNAQTTINKLLTLRVTKFEYGFLLGLNNHNPTPEQERVLSKINNRYAHVWAQGEIRNDYPNGTK